MIGALRFAALVAVILASACSQYRLIGESCGPDGCDGPPGLDKPIGCGQQFTLPLVKVAPYATHERCAVYTLDQLASPPGDDRVYISKVQVLPAPLGQDVDLRIAPVIDDIDDGPLEACTQVTALAIPWLPLMTSFGEGQAWDFSSAPLVASNTYRLFIDDSFTNLGSSDADSGLTINVVCSDTRPLTVSQSFEMTKSADLHVGSFTQASIQGSCNFEKDVVVSRLYRRTKLITSFLVTPLGTSDQIWQSTYDWLHDLDPPRAVKRGDGFSWTCNYVTAENEVDIRSNSDDACSLFGIYRLPDGGEDPSPEHCRH